MNRPGLRTTLLAPLIAALTFGSVGLGLFIDKAAERHQLETVDLEVGRAARRADAAAQQHC